MRNFTWILLCFVICPEVAHGGGSSFSSYGYGLVVYAPNVRSDGMGRTGIAMPSLNSVNLFNPAALMGITMVRADASAYYEQLAVKDRSATANSNSANFGHFALGIPFGKRLAAAISMMPYTRMGYEYKVQSTDELGTARTETFRGSGGIQLLGFTFAVRPQPHWSAGISLQYALGSTERTWRVNWNSPDISNTDNSYVHNLSGLRWVVGGLYSHDKYRFGAFVAVANRLNDQITQTRGTEDTVLSTGRKSDFPTEVGLGMSYNLNSRYTLAADIVGTFWKSVQVGGSDAGFRNTIRVGVGAERAPKAELSVHYLESLHYRAGMYFQNLYAENTSGRGASEYFLTAGVGLPFFRGRNVLDVSVELGQRGSVASNKVRETVFRLNVSISGGEPWFQNRKKRSQANN